MEKEGVEINWFDAMDYTKLKNFVTEKLGSNAIFILNSLNLILKDN